MKRVLFICSQNRLRSPTAERVFSSYPNVETASAGLDDDATIRVSSDLLAWADLIFVMETSHRNKLTRKFRPQVKGKRVVCLGIPDEYEFMDPGLVRLLKARVGRHLS